MKKVRKAFILLIFFLSAKMLPGEDLFPVRAFRSFEKGNWPELPQNSITELVQDQRGILWIGTLDGVVTFDGLRLKLLENDPLAPAKGLILGIACDHQGHVFVSTNIGVHRFDYQKWLLIDSEAPMMRIIADKKGRLWGQKLGNELFFLEEKNGAFFWQRPPIPLHKRCEIFFPYDEENIFYTINNQVYHFNGSRLNEICPQDRIPDRLTIFFVSRKGRIFAGTDSGKLFTALIDSQKWQKIEIKNWQGGGLRRIVEDHQGNFWIAGFRQDLIYGNFENGWTVWTKENGLKDAGILSLLVDREKTLWIGYNGTGLHQLLSHEWQHRVGEKSDLLSSKPFSVFGISRRFRQGFLAAVFNQGIMSWDGKKFEFYDREDGLEEDVRHAVEPEEGVIWAGCRFGIYEKRGRNRFKRVYELPGGFATRFIRLDSGDWLCATSNRGFLIKKKGAAKWKDADELNQKLPDGQIRAVAVCNKTELWVASLKGITIFYNNDNAELINFKDNPLLPQTVNAICQMKNGEIWLGGSGGIAIYTQKSWQRFPENERLPGNTIYAIAENQLNGEIWLTGSEGVACKYKEKWIHYSAKNGLIEEECNRNGLLINDDGTVLVGTMRSLAFFKSEREKREEALTVKTYWLQLPDFKKTKEGLVYPAGAATLFFSWHSPYLKPQQIFYQLRANKISEKLLELKSDNSLLLTRPASGWWDIEVLARIDDGENLINCQPLKISFYIQPRFIETIWFKLISALIVLTFAWLIFLWRIGIVKKRNAMLDRLVAQKTEELNASNQELSLLNAKLKELASVDHLTGLLNRRVIEERLNEYLALLERQKKPLTILLFDLDYFKQINDTFGHEIGDQALKSIADLMKKTFRTSDLSARFGGDEFLVVFPDSNEREVKSVLKRFLLNLSRIRISAKENIELTLSISGGAVSLIPERNITFDYLLRKADQGLYQAKASGRDRIVWVD